MLVEQCARRLRASCVEGVVKLGLFDTFERGYRGVRQHAEDQFTFVNRSAEPAAASVRELLDSWFAAYANCDKGELRSMFRHDFDAAFWQLVVHAYLRGLGCEPEVHPLHLHSQSGPSPDYHVTFAQGGPCYVEATVDRDESDSDKKKRNRLAPLYDEIERIDSPSFYICLKDLQDAPEVQPSPKKLRAFVEEKIRCLDPDEVTAAAERYGNGTLPEWHYKDRGFAITVSVIPKTPAGRMKPGTDSLGSMPVEMRWGGTAPSIRGSVLAKAKRYGQLDAPYVVAVNSVSRWGTTTRHIVEALFGSRDIDGEGRLGRATEISLWNGPEGPWNRRVSAVLIGTVGPWDLGRARVCVYHNPYANRPCDALPWRVAEASIVDGVLQVQEGESIGEVLGLQPDWPGKLFDE